MKSKPTASVFTPKIQKYILENRLSISANKMEAKLGIPQKKIRDFMKSKGLGLTREETLKLRSIGQTGRTTFTKKEDKYIKDNYLKIPVKALAKNINRSGFGTINRMRVLGLVIPPEIVERNRKAGQYPPGHAPMNKGLKQADYMTEDAIERCKVSQFKKNNLPHNTAEADGVIRIRNDKSGAKYKWIRMSLGVWKMLHVHIWEQANGKVPEGHIITFKDKNRLNVVLENLQMLTLAENMQNNTIHNFPQDLKDIIILKGAIKRQITLNNKRQ